MQISPLRVQFEPEKERKREPNRILLLLEEDGGGKRRPLMKIPFDIVAEKAVADSQVETEEEEDEEGDSPTITNNFNEVANLTGG